MRIPIRSDSPILRRSFSILVILVLLVSASGIMAASPSPVRTFRTANNILLVAGEPLPVFQFVKPSITSQGTQELANLFPPLAEQKVQQDTYLGNARFTVGNETQHTILEQFGATGGFYAYNPDDAYSETARGKLDKLAAQFQACQFLLNSNLLPDPNIVSVGEPTKLQCDYNFSLNPYKVVEAYAQGTTQGMTQDAEQAILIALLVQLPMALNTGEHSQVPSIPLSGPGGHISLLFKTTSADEGFSLNPRVAPGLSAVAMPFFGRQVSFLKNVPSRDPAEVKQQVLDTVKSSFPEGASVTIPDNQPQLTYWVSDAAQPQTTLEPTFEFEGVTVTVDGQDVVLKDIVVPAVQGGAGGLGPTVAITAPANASTFKMGDTVNLTGTIANGTKPYHYSWTLEDGTLLAEGDQAEPGTVNASAQNLPAVSHGGVPSPVVVKLTVTDADDVTREDVVSISPMSAPSVWLPAVGIDTIGNIAASQGEEQNSLARVKPNNMAAYSFGIESGSDYPPYGAGGSDLPGVPPDANGFRNGLLGYGWTQKFYWSNASAWEKDWRDCSLGGIDCTWGVDRVDFAYYSGHGSNGGISLPSSVDSSWFPGDKARFQNVRWAGFSSCLTLRAQWPTPADAPIRKWFNAFQGAHMLLGFNSLMADIAFGPRLVDNMRIPSFIGIEFPWAQLTIRQAWVQTAFEMNAGRPAYIYAVGTNGVNPVDNKLPKAGDAPLPRPYPVASYHWVWWND